MAISDVCKYEVKKEIDDCVAKGMSRNEASNWLSEVLSEALGREIKPGTIRQKDLRVRQELATNVATKEEEWPNCKKCDRYPLQIKKSGLSRLRLEKKLPFCNLTKFNRIYLVSDILEFLVGQRIIINRDA